MTMIEKTTEPCHIYLLRSVSQEYLLRQKFIPQTKTHITPATSRKVQDSILDTRSTETASQKERKRSTKFYTSTNDD